MVVERKFAGLTTYYYLLLRACKGEGEKEGSARDGAAAGGRRQRRRLLTVAASPNLLEPRGPQPEAAAPQQSPVGPRGCNGVGSSVAVVGSPPHPAGLSLRTKQVCDVTIAPFPRRAPPAKSFVSVLNKRRRMLCAVTAET